MTSRLRLRASCKVSHSNGSRLRAIQLLRHTLPLNVVLREGSPIRMSPSPLKSRAQPKRHRTQLHSWAGRNLSGARAAIATEIGTAADFATTTASGVGHGSHMHKLPPWAVWSSRLPSLLSSALQPRKVRPHRPAAPLCCPGNHFQSMVASQPLKPPPARLRLL